MNDIGEYMGEIEVRLSDFEVRLTAIEKLFTALPGVGMESDPSRLPTVVIEKSVGGAV